MGRVTIKPKHTLSLPFWQAFFKKGLLMIKYLLNKISLSKPLRAILIVILITTLAIESSCIIHASGNDGEISNNKDLVTPAVDGITSVFFEYVSDGLSFMVGQFSDKFSPVPDSDYFFEQTGTGSADNDFFAFFFYLGYFLTFTVFSISLLMVALSGFFENKNRSIELLVRLLIACVLIVLSRRILSAIDASFQVVWDQIKSVGEYAGSSGDTELAKNLAVQTATAGLGVPIILIDLILMIAFFIEFIKFVLEIMERYIVVKLLYLAAPTVNGMVVSRTTSGIMVNFYRMYFSQLLLLLFNRFFSFLLCAMVASVFAVQEWKPLPWLFLIATCKAAQRVDSYMKSLGLTVAQTGSALLDSVMGAVGMFGKGFGIAKSGAGFIGAAQMNAAVSSGDYGLFKAGMAKQAFAKGGLAGAIAPKSEASTLKAFAEAGGGLSANTIGNNSSNKNALAKAMTDSFNRGNYTNLATFDTSTQTVAARNVLSGLGNEDAFRKATGFNTSAIKSAHFDSRGNIEGIIEYGKNKGQVSTFKVSSDELKGRAGTIATSDGQIRNIQTTGDISRMAESGSYEYTEGGKSNLSTMSGIDLDDARLAELGASSYVVDRDDNMLYVGDAEGNVIYERGLETGNEIYSGIDKPYIDNSGNKITPTPNITEKDFDIDHKLENFAPTGVQSIEYHNKTNSASIQTNPTRVGGGTSEITIKGTSGTISKLHTTDNNPRYTFSGGNRINLNDKNIKIIGNREQGTYAVYGRDEHSRKIKV